MHPTTQKYDFHQQTPNFNNRKEGIIITRLRTGHTKLTHERKIKKTTPPALIAITHILHECHTTETQRQKYGINANINLTCQDDIQKSIKISQKHKLLYTYLMTSLSMRHYRKIEEEEQLFKYCIVNGVICVQVAFSEGYSEFLTFSWPARSKILESSPLLLSWAYLSTVV